MKLGILGGSFNPPHKMHKDIALNLMKKNYVDKVIYVPTGNKYNKQNLASEIDRYNMLKIMCKDNKYLGVSDYEFNTNLTYTYQTLNYFKTLYSNDTIYFILGTDIFNEINTWKNYEYLLETFKFILIARNNDNTDELINKYSKYKDNILKCDLGDIQISSTMIRNELNNSNDYTNLEHYLDKKVIKYIKKHCLYTNISSL